MSFAVAGLKTPGIIIRNERCVEKSFPNFWEVFSKL
jgi:3-phosphoshikimate 1-carboxyvinyltransferase